MSTSQHSQLSIVPGISRREESESSDGRCEPTIGLKAVAKILDCSAEQCRRLAEAKKIPVFRIGYRWKSTASAIVRWREGTASIDTPFACRVPENEDQHRPTRSTRREIWRCP
jgi:hypothetical protein